MVEPSETGRIPVRSSGRGSNAWIGLTVLAGVALLIAVLLLKRNPASEGGERVNDSSRREAGERALTPDAEPPHVERGARPEQAIPERKPIAVTRVWNEFDDPAFDYPPLTREADEIVMRDAGDLDWVLESDTWNPKKTQLSEAQREQLLEIVVAKQTEFRTLNLTLTKDASDVLRSLHALGDEIEVRRKFPRPEGLHRNLISQLPGGGHVFDFPLTPVHLPEVAYDLYVVNGIAISLAEEVKAFLANPP